MVPVARLWIDLYSNETEVLFDLVDLEPTGFQGESTKDGPGAMAAPIDITNSMDVSERLAGWEGQIDSISRLSRQAIKDVCKFTRTAINAFEEDQEPVIVISQEIEL